MGDGTMGYIKAKALLIYKKPRCDMGDGGGSTKMGSWSFWNWDAKKSAFNNFF